MENDNAFPEFGQSGDPCPICKTKAKTLTILIPIVRGKEGHTVQAKQIHKECFDLFNKMYEIEQKGKDDG